MYTCVCLSSDQFEKVKRYYRESQEAERQCNASVSGPESPVGESRRTRTETEDLLDKSRDRFLRTVAAHKKSLSELDTKAHEVDRKVHHLSHKVRSSAQDTINSFLWPHW